MLNVEFISDLTRSSKVEQLKHVAAPLQERLINHPLYTSIKSLTALQLFMEYHIFAVWDFMSLLKALQNKLSCTQVPWIPGKNARLSRLINEIVLGEECDEIDGSVYSHMEYYVLAMNDLGCDTSLITKLLDKVGECGNYRQAVEGLPIPQAAKQFMDNTFSIIESNDVVAIAAAFTMGRETLVPEMFIEIVKGIKNIGSINPEKLIKYLERHIELDGGEHGPLAFQMVTDLCGNDDALWDRAADSVVRSLQARTALWDSIVLAITGVNTDKRQVAPVLDGILG